jgi:uncharacterized protein YndB with AHSA1/START domain
MSLFAATLALVASPWPIVADVLDSAAGGFTVKTVVNIAAPPAQVYRALVEHVGSWWESSHTFSGDAKNLSIEGRAGGCFCERLADGGSVRHLAVVFASPGKTLRMIGGLGPLQDIAVTGVMTWKLSEAAGKTQTEVTYQVGGYSPKGLQDLAPVVDGVLRSQLQRLRRFVETESGHPDEP